MKKIMLMIALVVLLMPIISAAELQTSINIPKTEYTVGDTVMTAVSITAISSEFSGIVIIDYIVPEGSTNYDSEPLEEEISLGVGETMELTYPEQISEVSPAGQYTAVLMILDENENIVVEKGVHFNVTGTKMILELDLLTCEDAGCLKKKSIFTKNEEVYLNYEANAENPTLETRLTLPDSSTKEIDMPGKIKAEQVGTYHLEVIGSGEGFLTLTINKEFGVIKQDAVIESVSVCAVDGVCSGKEDYQNCPQDCERPKSKSSADTLNSGYWIIGLILFVLLAGYFIYKKQAKK